jgi:hypothetical protein
MKNGTKSAIDKATVGSAGTFYVAAYLSSRGIIVTPTLGNTRLIDILVSDGQDTRMIQVKTSSATQREWLLDKSIEDSASDNLFFCFVDLKRIDQLPDFYIVPSKNVASYCKDGHSKWTAEAEGPTRAKREAMKERKFRDKEQRYLNQWNLLGLKFPK